ncbi:MAG: arginine--tRNA ligase [Elusimicrobia bacterium CG11_big_fil_rev_8_21_14_0_20_64_6]|nr:MAG: arginine--tRNA ligase [Elusimicrobia bacterium CG11_big_fil_rev_8_21_14_0_20_64_6]
MIIAALRKKLAYEARKWATASDVALPDNLAVNVPPAHVKADLCLPWPLAAAKASKRNPLELAKSLAEHLSKVAEIESALPSPPGFVNVTIKQTTLCANLKAITLAPKTYGEDEGGPNTRVLIEFVSANPTGPLHMASGRGATLGDSLVRIMNRLGRQASAEYYVNDGGDRVILLGESIMARYKQSKGEDAQVPEKGYQGEYLVDLAAAAPAGNEKWDAPAWGRYAMDTLLASHKEDMKVFDANFDRWYLESELFASGAVPKTLEFLKGRGMVFEKDGAVWLGTQNAEGSTDDKDRVLVKSTGKPTYFLPDIAYHKDKYDRGFERVIDIFGADHHGYVPRMKAAIAALGKPPESYHAIVHQLIHLFRGSEAVKMSKRAGTFISLREIVDEVGKNACRFFFALRTPDSHLNFDLELAKKQSSENPVFYVQYVHARICSIFRKAAETGLHAAGAALPMPNARYLTAPEERAILNKLAWFPDVLLDCERLLSPHPLANYLMELAGLFHPFYEKCPVVTSNDPEEGKARLLLIAGVRDAIREGLDLLGVNSPDQM